MEQILAPASPCAHPGDSPDFHRSGLPGRKAEIAPSSRATVVLRRLSMREVVLRFLNNDSGATAIEYGLIAAGISVVIIVAVNTIGTNLNGVFTSVSSQLK
jgi:pilus assembly protein Flp/PilA